MAETGDDRDNRGRFVAGHAPLAKAGSPRFAITRELRRLVDPTAIAEFLINMATNPTNPTKARLEACAIILDRLEGKPAQSVSVTATAATNALPQGWDEMSEAERARYLDQHLGALALPESTH